MMGKEYKHEKSDRRAASWLSSIGGVSPSECLSSVNTSLETMVNKIEAGLHMDVLGVDVRELCMEVNRLIDHVKVSGVHCSALTYEGLLATLARLRIAVVQMRSCNNGTTTTSNTNTINHKRNNHGSRMSVCTTHHTHRIRTPRLPKDLSV